MPESPKGVTPPLSPPVPGSREPVKEVCERCGHEMYRMHAVWRCPACGFKTDCCGW
jgi:ribosomal protein L37E